MNRKAKKRLRRELVARALEKGQTKAEAEKTADRMLLVAEQAERELPERPGARLLALRTALVEQGVAAGIPEERARATAARVIGRRNGT